MERRILHTKLKTDDWVASLDDQQYRIFITLLLMTNSIGIFKTTIFEISAFSRQDYQTVKTVLEQFETVSKVFFIDEHIILANHSKYYVFDNPNQVRGACKEIQNIPETVLSDKRVLVVIAKLAEKLLPKANESDTNWLTERIETVPEGFETVPETYNIIHNTSNIIHKTKKIKEKKELPQLSDVKLLEFVNGIIQKGIDEQSTMKSNLVCLLTDEHVKKLTDEYGYEMLYAMCQVFYKWKIKATKRVKSDYLSIIQDWVIEKAKTIKIDIPKTKTLTPEQEKEKIAKRQERLKELGVLT